MPPNTIIQIAQAIGAMSVVAYFVAALIWFKPLPQFEGEWGSNSFFCELNAFLRTHQGESVRFNQTWVPMGTAGNFDSSDPNYDLLLDRAYQGCMFNNENIVPVAFFDDGYPKLDELGTEYVFKSRTELDGGVVSQLALSLTLTNVPALIGYAERHLTLTGDFDVSFANSDQTADWIIVRPAVEDSDLLVQRRCRSLVDSLGSIFGRALCPLAIIGS